jgi:hypothetical protein
MYSLLRNLLRAALLCLVIFGAAPPSHAVDDDADGIDDAFEDELVRRFAPELRFHPDEEYFLSSAEWYLERVELWFHGACNDRFVMGSALGPALLTQESDEGVLVWSDDGGRWVCLDSRVGGRRHRSGWSYPLQSGYYLRVPAEDAGAIRPGTPGSEEIYAHVRRSPDHHPGLYDITYWFFYPYNPDVCFTLGEHEADWEHVTVRVELDGDGVPRLHSMAFAAHGDPDWFGPDDIAYNASGRPVVYVALGSHASYPTRGKQHRNNVCDDHTGWTGESYVFDSAARVTRTGERGHPTRPFFEFSGRWGQRLPGPNLTDTGMQSPEGPLYKGKWEADDPEPSEVDHPDSHPWVFAKPGATGIGYWEDPLFGVRAGTLAYMVQDRCQLMDFGGGATRCGIEVLISPGSYDEVGEYAGPMVMRAVGGQVVIGR